MTLNDIKKAGRRLADARLSEKEYNLVNYFSKSPHSGWFSNHFFA